MTFKTLALGTITTLAMTIPAWAADIMVKDAYARSGAKSGAAFMQIMNHTDADDRLIAASTDVAPVVELHTHIEDANGVMRMVEVEDGIAVPAGGMASLQRGGDHVMFMGLDAPFEQGSTIEVTLTFENAGDIVVEIPVDNERQPGHGGGHGSMGHNHGNDG